MRQRIRQDIAHRNRQLMTVDVIARAAAARMNVDADDDATPMQLAVIAAKINGCLPPERVNVR